MGVGKAISRLGATPISATPGSMLDACPRRMCRYRERAMARLGAAEDEICYAGARGDPLSSNTCSTEAFLEEGLAV